MTDQTRWGIDHGATRKQSESLQRTKREMRDDLAFYVLNCSVYQLQKMTERMKQIKK